MHQHEAKIDKILKIVKMLKYYFQSYDLPWLLWPDNMCIYILTEIFWLHMFFCEQFVFPSLTVPTKFKMNVFDRDQDFGEYPSTWWICAREYLKLNLLDEFVPGNIPSFYV